MKVTLELNNMYRVANNIEVLERVIKTHHNLSLYEVGLLIDTKTILEGIREQTEIKLNFYNKGVFIDEQN